MAIFEGELNTTEPTPKLEEMELPKYSLGSPPIRDVDVSIGGGNYGIYANPSQTFSGLTLKQLSQIRVAPKSGFDSPMSIIPRSELLANQRYGTYVRDMDLENVYSLTQPWYKQLGSGIVKMAATGGATFLQSFATLPNTVAALKKGDFAELSGKDGYESDLDIWLKNIEDTFPNYVSRWERENPYGGVIPFTRGSANFWGDKIIKNLGFTVGAIGGALAQDAIVGLVTEGVGAVPLIGLQIGRASLYLNKLFAGSNKLDKVLDIAKSLNKTEKQLLTLKNLAYAAEATKLSNGFRYGLSLYGASRTEAAVESRDAYRTIKDQLISQYRKDNGVDPSGAALDEIEKYATDGMNVRFGINMALLTASNAIQFGSLFKSFTNASKGAPGLFEAPVGDLGKVGLTKGSIDVFEKKATTGLGAKVWESIKPTVKNVFTEGVYEEGGQFAAEKGVYDYYTRKYKNLKNPEYAKTWNTLNEVIKSTNEGLAEQFGSTEGIQNMLIGGISALITGGVSGKVRRLRGEPSKDQRLQSAINILNNHKVTGILGDQYDSTLNSANIAREMQDAANSGDVYKYKNLKHDQFFTYVMSRIPAGMHDITIEQLRMLKDLDKEQFEKAFGMSFDESNKKTVGEYVDALISKANSIKETADSLDFTFKNPFRNYVDPKTPEETEERLKHIIFNNWKKDLAYYASAEQDTKERLLSIEQDLSKINPLIDLDLVSKLTNKEGLQELTREYESQATTLEKSINEYTTPEDKRKLKSQVKALRTAIEKINLAISAKNLDTKTFEQLINFEIGGRTDITAKNYPSEKTANLFTFATDVNSLNARRDAASQSFDALTTEGGVNKYFEQADEMEKESEKEEEEKPEQQPLTQTPQYTYKNAAGEIKPIDLNREYQIPTAKVAKLNKINDDKYEVVSPNGTITFYDNLEDAKEALDEINADLSELAKVKVIALNPDGTIKVEDISGNIQNIRAEDLEGYEGLETEQEKIAKQKDQIDKEQKEIETRSGTVNTGDPTKETWEEEGFLKDANWLFTSGITESEDWADTTKSSPHVIRARKFLRKAKRLSNRNKLRAILVTPIQVKALGLEGIIQLSYKKDLTSDIYELGKLTLNTESGSRKITIEEYNSLSKEEKKNVVSEGIFDLDNGFVAQVFTVQEADGLYYVDEKGEKISKVGEQVDLNRVVFQTMPTTSLVDSRGNPRYRKDQKDVAEKMAEAWKKKRAELFSAPENSYTTYEFVISRGIPEPSIVVNGIKEKNHVGTTLIDEDQKEAEKIISSQQGLILIPTRDTISHNGRLLKVPKGRPVLQFGDTLEFLNNKKFSRSQAKSIFEVMKAIAEETVTQSKEGKEIKFNRSYSLFLQNVLFWVKGTTTSGNQMYIDEKNIYIGGKAYSLVDFADKESEIVQQLEETYNNVNNKSLTEYFSEPFVEFYYEDGEIKDREWKNYQSYLLSSKTPDGKARNINETPLSTTIPTPSASIPYTHKQKYAILIGMELPISQPQTSTPPPAGGTTEAPKIGEYVADGTTKNKIKLKEPIGEIEFVASIDGTNKVSVKVFSGPNTEAIAKDAAKVKPYLDFLKAAGKFDAKKDVEQLLLEFISMNVAQRLQTQLNEQIKNAKPAGATEVISEEEYKNFIDKNIVSDVILNSIAGKVVSRAPLSERELVIFNGRVADINEIIRKKKAPTTDSDKEIRDKIKSLPDSVYNNDKNTGLFLDVIIDKTKDYKKGADINQEGFIVNFSGVDSKDDIKLTINSVSKEGDNYRIIGRGGIGAKAASYNFLVSPSGEILSITSAEGKTFSGQTNANIRPTEAIRKSIQSTSNKDLMNRLASLATAPVSTDAKAEVERIVNAFEPDDNFKSPVDAWGVFTTRDEEAIKPEIYVEIKGNDYTKKELLDIEDPENPAVQETLNEIDRLQKLLDAELAASEGTKPQEKELKTVESAIRAVFGFYDQAKRNQEAGNKLRDDEKDVINDPLKYLEKERDGYQNSINEIIPKQIASLEASKAKKNEKEIAKINEKIEANKKDLARYEEWLKQIDGVIAKVREVIASSEKSSKTGEQTKKDPNKFDGFDGPSGDFRRISLGEVGGMTEEEIELFKAWHAENVPFIPYEILENIIKTHNGGRAWGVFENGVAKFVRGGLRGTEYHEVFEAIWKGFLTEQEKVALMTEFRSRSGQFVDRESGMRIDYSAATDRQIKERIADDFSDFRLGKLPARNLSERILRFFKAIIDFFRSFVTKPSLKDKLFNAIDTGKFKERVLPESVKNEAAEYRAVEGLTEQQTHEFVEDMTARAAGILFKEADKKTLFSPEGITSVKMFSEIERMYESERNASGFSKRDMLSDEAWSQLKSKTKNYLRTLGINFNEEDRVNINDENHDGRMYAAEPFSTDWKKSSPFAIKFTLATLLKTVAINQKNNLRLELPKADTSTIGYKLINFSRAFATLMDKMSNTTSVSKLVEKLIDISNRDSDYVRLFRRLGGVTTKEGESYIPFENFDRHDWRLFINFFQVFTKQKPEAIIQYRSEGDVYSRPAAFFSASKEVELSWMENLKALALDRDSIVWLDRDSTTYKVNRRPLEGIDISKPRSAIGFISEIGIKFPMESFLKLSTDEQNQFMDSVSQIYNYLGSNEDVASIKGNTLGISGPVSKLSKLYVQVTNPNRENTHFNIDGKRAQNYADNNVSSVFENVFNEVDSLEELFEAMPHLKDVFSAGSQVLKKGGLFFDADGKRIKKMKVKTIEGTKIVDKNKGMSSAKLNLGDRFVQEINENLDGNYYILVPADSSTEWMMEMGNTISFIDVDSGRAWNKVYKIFQGYLMDDINLALDWKNREKLTNVGTKGKQLRFFKDILGKKELEEIESLINRGATEDEITDYVKDNIEAINNAVKDYINGTVNETIDILKENNKIITKDDGFKFPNLLDAFALKRNVGIDKNNMSEKDVNSLITFVNINYIINNIEYHKILFGDPYQFGIKEKDGKVILDETKRIKSFLSPRRTTFDHPEYNNHLNNEYNETPSGIALSGRTEAYPFGDPGYHNFKSYVNTVTIKDVKIAGSLANIMSAYGDVNETDAMSWLMDGTYREIKLKNGQWPDEAEAWHQWQMAWTRQNLPGYIYRNPALETEDKKMISKPAPKYTIEVLKPIVTGVKYEKSNIDLVLDKFSQMPIYYSMVKGTNLENLYLEMARKDVGYAIVESGRKVGAEGVHSLYNPDGSFNKSAFNNNIQIPWKAYGIQVENSYEGEKQQTRGSQITKLASIDLFENGQASEAAKLEYARNKRILDEMHENAYREFLKDFGIQDVGNGFATTADSNKRVSEMLVYEMLRRKLSDNAIDTVQLDENEQFRIPFEASPSYVQIRDILYSMIDKKILSPRMNGGAHVQVSSTMFESATKGRSLAIKTETGWRKITKKEYKKLSEEDKKKVVLTDDTLKFYTKEDPYCEILLPHWFGEKLMKEAKFKTKEALLTYLNDTEEGKKILRGIGFRIPTQALSSVEVFRVKGFLPEYMGATVVVPSEITTKAGSDFDIDKLSMYLKSVYLDPNGNIRLIQYKGSEEETKDFYSQVYENTIRKQIERIERFDEFRKRLVDIFDQIERYDGEETEMEYILSPEDYDFYEYHIKLIDEIDAQAEEAGLYTSDYIREQIDRLKDVKEELRAEILNEEMREKFVNRMYKKSLENEYYDSLEKLITLPENFERLIKPVDDAGIKDISDEIDSLINYDESNIMNRLLNRNYMTSLRHSFVVAKRWVGIGAVNITGHSLAQKTTLIVNTDMFNKLSGRDKDILGDGSIALPHNKVTINGREFISLSGKMDAEDKLYISDGLSGYITTFVDVAKDPYIMKIIKSDLAVGTFMFLQRVGVPIRTSAMFMNQPIIRTYLQMLDSRGSRNLFDKNIQVLAKMLFSDTTGDIASEIDINVDGLSDNIKKYYSGKKLSQEENAEQQKILDEFLKYAKMAEFNFKFTQATNYDTSKFRSAENLFKKESLTDKAIESNIISSVEEVLKSSHLKKQKDVLHSLADAMGVILKLDKYEFRNITNSVLRRFAEREFLSNDDYVKIAAKVKASFLDFIIQTKTGLNKDVRELLVDAGTAVVAQLEKAKIAHPEMKILQELQPASSDRIGGAKTVKLAVNIKEAYDENLYTGYMRELRDNPDTTNLYYNIIYASLLQNTYQYSVSIRNIIPIEDYAETITPIIDSLVSDESVQAFADQKWFERNNWQDEDVVRTVTPKFLFPIDFRTGEPIDPSTGMPTDEPIGVDEWGNEIYQYTSPSYIDIKDLGILGRDRKILFLGEKYNYVDVQSEIIKVPRVIQMDDGSRVDVMTGRTITPAMFNAMRKKGDISYRDYIGYEKVRDAYGNPVIAKVDKQGNVTYVYKLINLFGDGIFASEYYSDFKPSPINNGTIKLENEIPVADIVAYYGGVVSADEIASLQSMPRAATTVTSPVTDGRAKVAMQPMNVEKIKNGTKTTTTRSEREFEKIGIPIGQSATVNFGGQDFTVTNRGFLTVQEAGGKETMLKSEGYASVQDLLYQQTKDWISGKGRLYVYDIKPVQDVEAEIEDSGSIVYASDIDATGMTTSSPREGYVMVKFDRLDEEVEFKKSELELANADDLFEYSYFNNIEDEIDKMITVDNAKLKLLDVTDTDYEHMKILKLQSKSGRVFPAIIEYDEETGQTKIDPNPPSDEDLGLSDNMYDSEDFSC
jgi:hypothetical protein